MLVIPRSTYAALGSDGRSGSEAIVSLFAAGNGSQQAPALRLPDFIAGRLSKNLPASSYIPGLFVAPLYELLPSFVYKRLREGLANFGKQMKGFDTAEANVIGRLLRRSRFQSGWQNNRGGRLQQSRLIMFVRVRWRS